MICLAALLTLAFAGVKAQEMKETTMDSSYDTDLTKPLEPVFLKNAIEGFGWDRNWFLEVKGGASAFIGSPLGCGDLFDRTMPALQVGIGKWFSPSIGARITFQGLQFKNSNLEKKDYQMVHADLMYNITGTRGMNANGVARWDLVPFVGIGMARCSPWKACCSCTENMGSSHPFAFNYAVMIGYRPTTCLSTSTLTGMARRILLLQQHWLAQRQFLILLTSVI